VGGRNVNTIPYSKLSGLQRILEINGDHWSDNTGDYWSMNILEINRDHWSGNTGDYWSLL